VLQPEVWRKLQGSMRVLERKAEVERSSKSTRYHKAADKDISAMAGLSVLKRLIAAVRSN
jgi:hypothetical protein